MADDTDPRVGIWYQRLDKGQEFQVVAVDETAGLVEIQHFDGDIEEIDLDAWYRLDVEPIENPEDWSGTLDVSETDDLTGTQITDTPAEDWSEPLEEILKPEPPPARPAFDEGGDDWGEGFPEEALGGPEPSVPPSQEAAAGRKPRRPRTAWSED
jgi:hypothetical protein